MPNLKSKSWTDSYIHITYITITLDNDVCRRRTVYAKKNLPLGNDVCTFIHSKISKYVNNRMDAEKNQIFQSLEYFSD